MSKKSLRKLLQEAQRCVMAPCVYDCASARAVEMVGFPAMMLSGGELSRTDLLVAVGVYASQSNRSLFVHLTLRSINQGGWLPTPTTP